MRAAPEGLASRRMRDDDERTVSVVFCVPSAIPGAHGSWVPEQSDPPSASPPAKSQPQQEPQGAHWSRRGPHAGGSEAHSEIYELLDKQAWA